MSPTNLGVLPSNLPAPNQRVQFKRGAADSTVNVSNLVAAGTKLTDGTGNPMQISYIPLYNCLWLVRSNTMWHGIDGGWRRVDHSIRISPADLDGKVVGAQSIQQAYPSTTVEWRTAALSCMFRLAAGITYTAAICFEYSNGDYQAYHTGPTWIRILGVVIGEGEV